LAKKVVIYSTNKEFEATLVQQMLAGNDIASFIMNKMDYAYRFGDIEVLVEADDVMKAKLLIEKNFKNE